MKETKSAISLKNDGQLWIFFLGVGGAFSRRFFQTNLLIVKGDDHLLVDCGTRGSDALSEAGIGTGAISHFLPTHSHADHVGGLEELSLVSRYVTRHRPNMYITKKYQKILWERSMRGGCEMNERFNGKGLSFEDYWTPVRPKRIAELPRDGSTFSVGSLKITVFRTRHYPQQATSWKDAMYSLGVIVDDRVFFSGDTQYDEGFVEEFDELYNFEAIFHDVQFHAGGIHGSLAEIAALPEAIRKKTHLVHYGDQWENHVQEVKEYGFAGLTKQQIVYEFA